MDSEDTESDDDVYEYVYGPPKDASGAGEVINLQRGTRTRRAPDLYGELMPSGLIWTAEKTLSFVCIHSYFRRTYKICMNLAIFDSGLQSKREVFWVVGKICVSPVWRL